MVGNFVSHKAASKLLLFQRLKQLSQQATSLSAVSFHLRLSLRGIINLDIAVCSASKVCDVLIKPRTGLPCLSVISESLWNQMGIQFYSKESTSCKGKKLYLLQLHLWIMVGFSTHWWKLRILNIVLSNKLYCIWMEYFENNGLVLENTFLRKRVELRIIKDVSWNPSPNASFP